MIPPITLGNEEVRLDLHAKGESTIIQITTSDTCVEVALNEKETDDVIKWMLALQMIRKTLATPPSFKIAMPEDICDGCKEIYDRHRVHDSFSWLRLLCSGSWVRIDND